MAISPTYVAVHGVDAALAPYKQEARRASKERCIPLCQSQAEIAAREGYRNWSLLKRDLPRLASKHDAPLAALLNAALSGFDFDDKVGPPEAHIVPKDGGPGRTHTILGGLVAYPQERREIERWHRRLVLFRKIHPDSPLRPYAEREKIKEAGRQTLLRSDQVQACLTGMVQIAVSYFARSASRQITGERRLEEHPAFWTFTAHLVRSDFWEDDFTNPAATQALQHLTSMLPLMTPSRVTQTFWDFHK